MNINNAIPAHLKGKISFSEDIPGPAFVDKKLGEFDVTTLTDKKVEKLIADQFPFILKTEENKDTDAKPKVEKKGSNEDKTKIKGSEL